jgi:hypothetical protein
MPQKQVEYVMISTSQGKVYKIEPDAPDTLTALEAAKKLNGTLVDAINKMAEYGYQLHPGTALVSDTSIDGAYVTVFMSREI